MCAEVAFDVHISRQTLWNETQNIEIKSIVLLS